MPRTEEANQEIRELRKLKILEISTKVFARKGLTDTRISDIATEAGMSQGLIYRYFSSKDEVFAMLLEGTTAFMLQLCQEAQAEPGTGMDKLAWLTYQILPYIYNQPEGALVIMHSLINEGIPANVRQAVRIYSDKLQAIVREFIRQGQAEGKIVEGDPAKLTILYLSSLQGLAATASFLEQPPEAFPEASMILRFLQP